MAPLKHEILAEIINRLIEIRCEIAFFASQNGIYVAFDRRQHHKQRVKEFKASVRQLRMQCDVYRTNRDILEFEEGSDSLPGVDECVNIVSAPSMKHLLIIKDEREWRKIWTKIIINFEEEVKGACYNYIRLSDNTHPQDDHDFYEEKREEAARLVNVIRDVLKAIERANL